MGKAQGAGVASAVGDGAVGDGAVDDGAVDDGAVGDSAVGDSAVGDGAVDDGAVEDGADGAGTEARRADKAPAEELSVEPLPSPETTARVRQLTATDQAAVLCLAEQVGLTVDVQSLGRPPERECFVLALAGGVVGFLSLQHLAPEAEILDLVVDLGQRRQGHGGRLLTQVLAALAARGVTRVLLEVAADNAAALGLYRKHGFFEVGRRPRYYSSGQDAVLMDCCPPGAR